MDLLETLTAEHRLIERVLDALLQYVDRLGVDAPAGDLSKFVQFLQGFADSVHHGKEEDILFVQMVHAGFPRSGGPVAVMFAEHAEGRRLVTMLRESAARAGAWTPEDRAFVKQTARAFASLLYAHIRKEDQILYPMARANLSEEAVGEMNEALEEANRELGTLESAKWKQLSDILVSTYTEPLRPPTVEVSVHSAH